MIRVTKVQNPDWHWQPETKRMFLESLAASGSVDQAARACGKSRAAAYGLKHRLEEEAFRIGWGAAQIVAREAVLDTLTERFVDGVEMTSIRDKSDPDRIVTTRRSYQNRVGLALLTRLDRIVETQPAPDTVGGEAALVARSFAEWLDLVGTGAGLADTRALLETMKYEIQCKLADQDVENTAEILEDDDESEEAVQLRAARMQTWYHPEHGNWRCNFPPPDDFFGKEEGEFGCSPNYSRELTDEEEEHWGQIGKAVVEPLRAAGEAARRRYFELPELRTRAKRVKKARRIETKRALPPTEAAAESDWQDALEEPEPSPEICASSPPEEPSPEAVTVEDPEEFVNGIRVYIPGTKLFTDEYQKANNFRQHVPKRQPYQQIPWYSERIY